MNVTGIDLVNNGIGGLTIQNDTKVNGDNLGAFESLLSSAVNMYKEADTYQKNAEQAEINFALGYSTSTHDLALAQQKANIALQYTVRVTNKAIEAYKELMNMQL